MSVLSPPNRHVSDIICTVRLVRISFCMAVDRLGPMPQLSLTTMRAHTYLNVFIAVMDLGCGVPERYATRLWNGACSIRRGHV